MLRAKTCTKEASGGPRRAELREGGRRAAGGFGRSKVCPLRARARRTAGAAGRRSALALRRMIPDAIVTRRTTGELCCELASARARKPPEWGSPVEDCLARCASPPPRSTQPRVWHTRVLFHRLSEAVWCAALDTRRPDPPAAAAAASPPAASPQACPHCAHRRHTALPSVEKRHRAVSQCPAAMLPNYGLASYWYGPGLAFTWQRHPPADSRGLVRAVAGTSGSRRTATSWTGTSATRS